MVALSPWLPAQPSMRWRLRQGTRVMGRSRSGSPLGPASKAMAQWGPPAARTMRARRLAMARPSGMSRAAEGAEVVAAAPALPASGGLGGLLGWEADGACG